jgi:hypothetical protein
VDGELDESALVERASQIGAPEDFLQQLLAAGLIEARGSLREMLG